MGITAEEILDKLKELQDSMKYWASCQPFLAKDIPFAKLDHLIAIVETIKTKQDSRQR